MVTGVAGFLGSHMADRLLADGHEVAGVDNLLGGDTENVPRGVDFEEQDCRYVEVLGRLLAGADVVVHCAAAPHEGLSVFSPNLVARHTFMSTVGVATAAIQAGVKRVVFTSSTARYGRQSLPFEEWMPTKPVDPYGVFKVASEQTLQALSAAHGIEVVIAVPHNIVGPRQKYDDPFRNVASIMANRMLRGLPPVIYGDGLQTRSFSFISDCVDPLARIVTEPIVAGQNVINIGPDDPPITIRRLYEILRELTGFAGEPLYVADRPLEVKHTWVSANLARRLLGYEPKTRLEDGLAQLVDWIRLKGPKPFTYHLPIEITSATLPVTWSQKLL